MRKNSRNTRLYRIFMAVTAASLFAFSLGLVGCQQASNAGSDRVAELEEEVADLQEHLGQQNGSGTAEGQNNADGNAATQDSDDADSSIAAFEKQVASLEDECAAVKATGNRSDDYQTYLDMESKIDEVERAMDVYDEQQEAAARSGELSRQDYIQIEHDLDALDERLDRASEGLERTLRVDD